MKDTLRELARFAMEHDIAIILQTQPCRPPGARSTPVYKPEDGIVLIDYCDLLNTSKDRGQ